MRYEEVYGATLFETQDGEKYWAEDGANYIEGAGTVVLNCLSSDGTETADSFSKIEALGLAIDLAQAAGLDGAVLYPTRNALHQMVLTELLKDFSVQERADINIFCLGLLGTPLSDVNLSIEIIEAVINTYRKEES